MRFDIITPFPEALGSYLGVSILKLAIAKRLILVRFFDPRSFVKDKHRTIDGKPYGGGAGMVLMAEPILKAVAAALRAKSEKRKVKSKTKIAVLSAKGRQFSQKIAHGWAKRFNHIVLISGRYEGIDERVRRALKAEEISIGPYVLTDGDAAAMVIVSAVARLIPGVIKLESLEEESHWGALVKREAGGGGLEYPHYTRPEIFRWKGRAYRVPKVLLSGNHAKIAAWRSHQRGRHSVSILRARVV